MAGGIATPEPEADANLKGNRSSEVIRSPAGRSEFKDGSVSPLEIKIHEFSEQIMGCGTTDEKNLMPSLPLPDISIRYCFSREATHRKAGLKRFDQLRLDRRISLVPLL
jgi:hypothetical protein